MTPRGSLAEARRDLLGDDEFDLVLCDIMMPDGNGLDLLREVKRSRGKRDLGHHDDRLHLDQDRRSRR